MPSRIIEQLHIPFAPTPQVIHATLAGDDTCSALGVTARGRSPVLSLCRRLVEAGNDPLRPLHCYRGCILALTVCSIGEGAQLEINGEGNGFRPYREPGAAPPIAPPEQTSVRCPGRAAIAGAAP